MLGYRSLVDDVHTSYEIATDQKDILEYQLVHKNTTYITHNSIVSNIIHSTTPSASTLPPNTLPSLST